MITKRFGHGGSVRVTFALPSAIWADRVSVVGDFNNWDSRATPLRLTDHGWVATVDLAIGQTYEYRYLLNGNEWCNDWQADGYTANLAGGANSLLITAEPAGDPRSLSPQRTSAYPTRLRLVAS